MCNFSILKLTFNGDFSLEMWKYITNIVLFDGDVETDFEAVKTLPVNFENIKFLKFSIFLKFLIFFHKYIFTVTTSRI